jgi:23S rRNA (uracil1939-C5)-methyltransferase
MQARQFRVTAGPLNERGYSIAQIFKETSTNDKRQPTTILILGMLPEEQGIVETFKVKRDVFYAHVLTFSKVHPDRVAPRDRESYLASSPYQILNMPAEQKLKKKFLSNLYGRDAEIFSNDQEYEYRNKVEFGFYEDYDNYSLRLSFFKREGSSGKYVLDNGTAIADPRINQLGLVVVQILENNKVIGKHLKTLMIRSTNQQLAANLYVTTQDFKELYPQAAQELQSLPVSIIYSDKNSPASNNNGILLHHSQTLTQTILNQEFQLALDGFFQVNIPVFQETIKDCLEIIKQENIEGTLIDYYCGVGVIGQLLASEFTQVIGVDSSQESERYSLDNAKHNNITNYTFHRANAESLTDLINNEDVLFLDPPRIGCHPTLIAKINQALPPYIFYLSCNPITQQANYLDLANNYEIISLKGYNFYPKTPHLESLLVLKRKD